MMRSSFDPIAYGSAVAEILDGDRLPELGPGHPNAAMRDQLASITLESLFAGRTISDDSLAKCCLSGLWLWHDYLDESHRISQDIATGEGSYWHAIMHRREPDYANAKYWFRRVGRHTIFAPLAEAAGEAAVWDPPGFVDVCEAIARGDSQRERWAREVGRAEWRLLFDYCWRGATATANTAKVPPVGLEPTTL